MTELPTRRTLKDFLGLPNGREEYVKFMVAYEAANNPDTRFTQQENEELFGLQFDLAAKSRELDKKLITQDDFNTYKEGHDHRIDAIVGSSRARNAAMSEAWAIYRRVEEQMQPDQKTPTAKQLEDAFRNSVLEAEKGKLLQKYVDSGHFREGGEMHRIMSPAEDTIRSLRKFLTSNNPENNAILAEAAFSFLEKETESDPRARALAAGLKSGLSSIGVLTQTAPDAGQHNNDDELGKLYQLGRELVQKMAEQPYSTTQFLSDFDLFGLIKSSERNSFVFLKAAIGHALLDEEWVSDLSPEQKTLVAADTRMRFTKPGEKFEGYHFRRADGKDEQGESINPQYFGDNTNKEKAYRLSEESEFVVDSRPMHVMTNYEYVRYTHGEASDGVVAYAVYSKPRQVNES